MKKTMMKIALLAGFAGFIIGSMTALKEVQNSLGGMNKANSYIKEYNALHDNLTKAGKVL